MNQEGFPNISKKLLEALDNAFPLEKPAMDWEDRRIWTMVGSRNVVDFLKETHEIQNEKGILASKHK